MPRIALRYRALLIAGLLGCNAAWAADWLPIDPQELRMTSEPKAPDAAAVYLYRQVDRSDADFDERFYVRIKILTAEGLSYANIEIPFDGQNESIRFIQARTVRPDGSSIDFDGKVYEKTVVKARNERLLTKTFTLPDVQVGSIIEYRYDHLLRRGWIYDSHWILSSDLYTEHAKFSLQPNTEFSMRWSWPRGLPEGTPNPKLEHGTIRLEAVGIPAFVEEDYMPPADELRMRVDFIYQSDHREATTPEEYWKIHGQSLYREVQKFSDADRVMKRAVAQITAPTDSPEEKLRKIYARVGQIDNLTFETKSQQEAKQQKPDSIDNVGDVWEKGYGNGRQITWLYLALVRAAGLAADPVLISTRDRYFFNKTLMNAGQLNSNVVVVSIAGKDLYLDPGYLYTPFGLLPWWEAGVSGLRLKKDGAVWVNTPLPGPAQSRTERKATFKLDRGMLTGKLTVTYTGLEASSRRASQRGQDETERKQYLENEVEWAVPTGVTVNLTNVPDWDSWEAPLVAQYDLEVPGWATGAGRRMLLPVALFGAGEKSMFTHAARTQPLYFANPYQHFDDVSIELPAGWNAESLPQARSEDLKRLAYRTTLVSDHQTLHFTRQLDFDLLLVNPTSYDAVRKFYQLVQTADAERVVLAPISANMVAK